MLLEHMSREKAEAYVGTVSYAMISITDPDSPEAKLRFDPNRIATLRLAFHDFTEEPEEFEALMAEAEDQPGEWVLPSAIHAQAIVGFYRSVAPKIEKLIVHCEAGVSRSAAVGAALAHCLGQADEQFFSRSHPNHRVRRLVIEAWDRS
jgi:predicted protein tyrosine phosphatase